MAVWWGIATLLFLLTLEAGATFLIPRNPFFGFPTVPAGEKIKLGPPRPGQPSAGFHSTNQLGLRGDEPPQDLEKSIQMVVLGGSTTHDFHLDDKNTWAYKFQEELKKEIPTVWVGNAGVLGHTLKGHETIFKSVVSELNPKFVAVKAGLNDARLLVVEKEDHAHTFTAFGKSRFMQFFLSTLPVLTGPRGVVTRTRPLGGFPPEDNLPGPDLSKAEGSIKRGLKIYEQKFTSLVTQIKERGMEPILITQTHLGINHPEDFQGPYQSSLAPIKPEFKNLRVYQFLEILKRHNKVVRKVCQKQSITCLDLEKKFPARDEYFYDTEHFTEEGAALAGKILAREFLDMNRKGSKELK